MFERSSVARALSNSNVQARYPIAKAYMDEAKKFQSIDDAIHAAEQAAASIMSLPYNTGIKEAAAFKASRYDNELEYFLTHLLMRFEEKAGKAYESLQNYR